MKAISINDFEDPILDPYVRLTENQLINREDLDNGLFIAETPMVIQRAIDAGYEPVSFVIENKYLDTFGERISKKFPDIPIYTSSIQVLTHMTGYNLTRGALAAFKRKRLKSIEQICSESKRIAVLENVMNPTNVGAIIRSAAALNIDAVLLTPGCSNPLFRRAIRVSMGNVFQIPWSFFETDTSYTEKLHLMGFKTVAMALRDDSNLIYDPVLQKEDRLAIVLGTEGDGLSNATIEKCDFTVKIPMTHGVDSLNVAAASAVAFYQLALVGRV